MAPGSILPDGGPIHRADAQTEAEYPRGSVIATEDPQLIQAWALRHSAEPATGEATSSGPATVDVRDGDAGIRFNFPAVARFRPITWDEWFENFRTFNLMFVYESDTPGKTPSGRYRLVPKDRLQQLTGIQ